MKRNLVLLALIFILGATIHLVVIRSDQKSVEENNQVIPLQFSEIQQVSVHYKGAVQDLAIERAGEGWRISRPFQGPADDLMVSEWLESLLATKAKELVFGPEENFSKEQFGLTDSSPVLELKGKEGLLQRLELSQSPEQEGFNYVYNETQKKLFFVPTFFSQQVLKAPEELRDKRLWSSAIDGVTEIQGIGGLTHWHLVQNGKNWIEKSVPGDKISQPKVKEYLAHLQDIRTLKVEGSAVTEGELATYGLLHPLLEVRMVGKKNLEFRFGSKEKSLGEYVFVQQVGDPTVYKVFTTSYDKLNQALKFFKEAP